MNKIDKKRQELFVPPQQWIIWQNVAKFFIIKLYLQEQIRQNHIQKNRQNQPFQIFLQVMMDAEEKSFIAMRTKHWSFLKINFTRQTVAGCLGWGCVRWQIVPKWTPSLDKYWTRSIQRHLCLSMGVLTETVQKTLIDLNKRHHNLQLWLKDSGAVFTVLKKFASLTSGQSRLCRWVSGRTQLFP